ncbi:hypothetical protein E3N88_15560 [Mikania micrantha]|uniref:Tf2-1-like SH3-like domain-containing protein n=1 Tax=Mikania micrantha TaxID=192012 RepID=A0A5N6NVR9_9ASTR|nr:hypothetical protein E3N88_15560 [Mikania micrantha]
MSNTTMMGEVGQKDMGSKTDVEYMANKLTQIRARIKAAQDRQKSYAEKRRRPIEFNVGDRELLKVSPWKGLIRFKKRGKLSPRYIGPFKILAKIGKVAYRLELPDELSSIHLTFHVSYLRKCLADETMFHMRKLKLMKNLVILRNPSQSLIRVKRDSEIRLLDQSAMEA